MSPSLIRIHSIISRMEANGMWKTAEDLRSLFAPEFEDARRGLK